MPIITEEFSHENIDTTCAAMYPIKTRSNDALDVWYTHKGATDVFYEDFKKVLSQCVELSPTFNDEEKSFTIFDSKFYIRCINTVDAPYYPNADQEYCVRPFLFKEGYEYRNPKIDIAGSYKQQSPNSYAFTYSNFGCSRDNHCDYNQMHYRNNAGNDCFLQGNVRNFNGLIFFYHSCFNNNIADNKIPAAYDNYNCYYYSNSAYYGYTYPGTQYARYGYDSSGTVIPYDKKTTAHYTIEIHYNINWIQITYRSDKGEKIPLGLFMVGTFTDPRTQEPEEILMTQLDGAMNIQNTYFSENTYWSNRISEGYPYFTYSTNNTSISQKVKYTSSRNGSTPGSGYYRGPLTWTQTMVFKKGHLSCVLEELGKQNVFYATNPNYYMNANISTDPVDNDFQLCNHVFTTYCYNIDQSTFGYMTPLDKKFFKVPVVGLNGMIKFDDNIIYGQYLSYNLNNSTILYQTFDSDTLYDIDDETYYCPFTSSRNYDTYNTNVNILLKI